ncbi:hypothetical protein [Tersicoccus sp. Bi-70]|uniref:hypothetical protein n=1 Tax=Tersicoccus sp. Bi-70 TaxID=1897634 RepID=UPI00097686AE|nr:hypothetical protein [Tersicoccus sp. Bi-70]OMH32571.1 hypothetical protein BGP79_07135 [Tersicoccus sp. Bi-70]
MNLTAADVTRFWERIVKGPAADDCWLWSGAIGDDGYGRFWMWTEHGQRVLRPHRLAWHLATGAEVDESLFMRHLCDRPLCVRATTDAQTHLVTGTHALNMADRARALRDTNAAPWGIAGLGRSRIAQTSRAIRDVLRDRGYDAAAIAAIAAGYNLDEPTLF